MLAKSIWLKNENNDRLVPKTSTRAVYKDDGSTLQETLSSVAYAVEEADTTVVIPESINYVTHDFYNRNIGNSDISSLGDGTITGALSVLASRPSGSTNNTTTVVEAKLPFVVVTDNGVSTAWSDQSGNIQKLINAATDTENNILFFPPGSYRLDSPVLLKSNITILCDKAQFVVLGNMAFYGSQYGVDEYISAGTIPQHIENVTIKGASFIIAPEKPAIRLKNVKNLLVEDIKSTGGGVWINTAFNVNANDGTTSPSESAGITSIEYGNLDITIRNIKAGNGDDWDNAPTGSDTPFARGIHIEYGNRVHIENCYIDGQAQGIQIWGGNAEPQLGGSTATQMYSNDIFINNCIVNRCSGGAIWGSMVNKMTVSNCSIDHTLDVGIDFESCWNSHANNNIIKNCKYGNLAIYSCCKHIIFSCNTSICDSTEYLNSAGAYYGAHFSLYNSANNPFEEDIILDGNEFIQTNGVIGEVTFGACRNRIVRNNYFENVRLVYNLATLGHRNSEISCNKFYWTIPAKNTKVIIAQSHSGDGFHNINGNTIHFTNGTSGTVSAIYCYGFNCEGNFLIQNNYIINMRYGVDKSIELVQEGNNTMYAIARNNVMNTQIGTTGSVNLIKSGNVSIGGTSFD